MWRRPTRVLLTRLMVAIWALAAGYASACGQLAEVVSVFANVEQAGNPAVQAVDDSLDTRWSGFGKGATLTLDLGAPTPVACARIAWYRGDRRQSAFSLSISNDAATFTPLFTGQSSGTTSNYETYRFAPATGRYLRLEVSGNSENDWASVNGMTVALPGFRHPGVLVSREQLDFVKERVREGGDPWRGAYERVLNSRYGSRSYAPHPRSIVECGSRSVPNEGCTDEMDDAIAAYTHALLWYFTEDPIHAERAVEIMNAWSSVITGHTNSNAPLQAGWAAEVWPRAAEIIRYTYSGWADQDIERFETMLREVYLPLIQDGWWGGNNWDLTMIDATMAIAVFTDDQALFDHSLGMWQGSVPAYIYLNSDGPLPVRPRVGRFDDGKLMDLWRNPQRLVDGMTMETCRDQAHTSMGLAAMVNAAETALIQGVNLYALEMNRIVAAAEFNTQFLNGAPVPSWLCNGTLNMAETNYRHTYEILYNHYAHRVGQRLDNTEQWNLSKRPTRALLHMDWETLTHADVGSAGIR